MIKKTYLKKKLNFPLKEKHQNCYLLIIISQGQCIEI